METKTRDEILLSNNVGIANTYTKDIRSKVIGILLSPFNNKVEGMIININEDHSVVDTVRFTQWGIINQDFGMPTDRFEVVMIPEEYGNLQALLDDPLEFGKFWDSLNV